MPKAGPRFHSPPISTSLTLAGYHTGTARRKISLAKRCDAQIFVASGACLRSSWRMKWRICWAISIDATVVAQLVPDVSDVAVGPFGFITVHARDPNGSIEPPF